MLYSKRADSCSHFGLHRWAVLEETRSTYIALWLNHVHLSHQPHNSLSHHTTSVWGTHNPCHTSHARRLYASYNLSCHPLTPHTPPLLPLMSPRVSEISLRYPVADSPDGAHLPIATTRPETILGDTAVAVHPGEPLMPAA